MARTLTAANSVILIGVTGLFDVPQQLQGFSADDVFDSEGVESAEAMMGVDGKLSAGWIPAPIRQNFTLQADSASNDFFENWYAAQQAVRELYRATGTIMLPSTGRKYTMVNGLLQNYSPTPAGKKVLQPRRFTILWESQSPGNI